MNESDRVPGFAPSDPTDGRKLLEWRSMYTDPEAKKAIRLEACYLGTLLIAAPALICSLWLDYPKTWFSIPTDKYSAVVKYGITWVSGTLGGTLFDIKWLYHSVARRVWHLDRRLWRIFTPHISGGLAFAVLALVSSGLVRIFDSKAVDSLPLVVGLGFLVGYFSDGAIAKLSEIARTIFGSSHDTMADEGSCEEDDSRQVSQRQ